ncbi:HTH-type transcriptional regulator MmpR5 [Candidatus Thermoflexus japonica]|uniref:HTH-type transcriptional regulator MmpR5 n=1 Tax=Candidatus Thermoflexus japonica TaxID=2035417 RepID=A0A2H5Y8B2_9CHLR|nr:HTH-type transcriptional regulator MmpR5 [Candidatus Thermoflexus japonica]
MARSRRGGKNGSERGSAEIRFVEAMGLYYEQFGMPRLAGRLFAWMLLADRPLPAEEIARALHVSRSSVSNALRPWLLGRLIEARSQPGDRRRYYILSPDVWTQAIRLRQEGLAPLRQLGESLLAALPASHPGRRRVQEMIEWADFMARVYEKALAEWSQRQKTAPPGKERGG